MRPCTFSVDKKGMALDIFLATHLPLSRRELRGCIHGGRVYVEGQRAFRANAPLERGQKILYFPGELARAPEGLESASLLHREEDLWVLNKPPLLASQATPDPRVPHVKAYLHQGWGAEARGLDLCHRLDKETSGLLLLARGKLQGEIMEAFKRRQVEKSYLALCHGRAPKGSWERRSYLRPPHGETGRVLEASSGGRFALSFFENLGSSPCGRVSLLLCRPKTGRTHQLRVHCAAMGLPIVGDKKYCLRQDLQLPRRLQWKALEHHRLHALGLKLHLRERELAFQAPLPPSFLDLLSH